MIGKLESLDAGRWRLRFTRRLPHPVERVWAALTEPDQLAAWFPQRIAGDLLTVGAPLRFESARGEHAGFDGRVVAVEPPSVLEFTWGADFLRFELAADGAGSVLTLLDTITEVGKAARDGAGWHACLDLLEVSLTGQAPEFTSGDRWAAVHPEYVGAFGPDAATIGPPAGAT